MRRHVHLDRVRVRLPDSAAGWGQAQTDALARDLAARLGDARLADAVARAIVARLNLEAHNAARTTRASLGQSAPPPPGPAARGRR